jgi:glycosyltransferase involved in cell wall biosynthesis
MLSEKTGYGKTNVSDSRDGDIHAGLPFTPLVSTFPLSFKRQFTISRSSPSVAKRYNKYGPRMNFDRPENRGATLPIRTNPRVSVVVPVYNKKQFFGECLDSLLNQTYPDIEVICVDDGSTDGSLDLAKRYAAGDERMVLLTQDHAGPSAARNAALDCARGEYVMFIDSDDFVDTGMLEKLVTKADETGAEIVIADYYLYFDETGELGTYRDQAVYAALDGKVFTIEEEPVMIQFIGVTDRLFRRDFIEEHGFRFPVGRIYEDVIFCFESELAAKKIALIADHLYYYRRGIVSSITGQEAGHNSFKDEFLYAQRCAQECLREAKVSKDVWKYYSWYFMEYSMIHQRQVYSYRYFRYFFNEIRSIARPEILSYKQRRATFGYDGHAVVSTVRSYGPRRFDVELFVYRVCLRFGWVLPSFLFLKGMNRLRHYGGTLLRRVVRARKGN